MHCNTFYEDGSKELLSGCSKCGGRFFFFIKKENLNKANNVALNLTQKEKAQIENDIYDIMGSEVDRSKPVVLDLEAIRILKPGQYELDIVRLLKKSPVVYRLEEGKYVIDLPSTFSSEEVKGGVSDERRAKK